MNFSAAIALLMIGFLGSWHCVGMCGPIMGIKCLNKKEAGFYQIGRLISYMALGYIAGSLGEFALASTQQKA